MLYNYFLIALRMLQKQKMYAFVSVVGMAVGISFFTLLLLLIRHELNFDRSFSKSERTYRVVQQVEKDGLGEHAASTMFRVGPTLYREYPDQVEAFVRLFNFQVRSHALAYGDKRYNEADFYFADQTFFQIFDFPLLLGNPSRVLNEPMSLVLSEDMAKKYFGDEDPIGKKLVYENRLTLTVTGVMRSPMPSSHLQAEFVASMNTLDPFFDEYSFMLGGVWNPFWTYILLKEETSPEDLEFYLPKAVRGLFPEVLREHTNLFLQPLTEIHFGTKLDFEISQNAEISYIYIFVAIATLILVITTINFANLSATRASGRAKEIGIRKAIGAYKTELMQQFLIEALLIGLTAIFAALILVELSIPLLEAFSNGQVDLRNVDTGNMLIGIFGGGIFIVVASIIYPAYYLANFRPAEALSGSLAIGLKGRSFRKTLMVLQLSLTLFLLITTSVTFKQLRYLNLTSLGFDRREVLVVPLADLPLRYQYDSLKAAFMQLDGVRSVSAMQEVIGMARQTRVYQAETANGTRTMFIPSIVVREDFIETMGIELLAGRKFEGDSTDAQGAVIINQALLADLGYEHPEEAIGQLMSDDFFVGKQIVGVARDFHFESLKKPIVPFLLDFTNIGYMPAFHAKYMAVRIDRNNRAVFNGLEETWGRIVPYRPFEYFPLSRQIGQLYTDQLKLGIISFYFALVAILMACLGLFGVAYFVAIQRKKEMAIRKAIGATNGQAMWLLAWEFVQTVGLAIVITWPLAYLLMRIWLDSFPFSTKINVGVFLWSGGIALFITLLTVSYHTVRAGLRNPIKDLNGN